MSTWSDRICRELVVPQPAPARWSFRLCSTVNDGTNTGTLRPQVYLPRIKPYTGIATGGRNEHLELANKSLPAGVCQLAMWWVLYSTPPINCDCSRIRNSVQRNAGSKPVALMATYVPQIMYSNRLIPDYLHRCLWVDMHRKIPGAYGGTTTWPKVFQLSFSGGDFHSFC